MSPRPIASHLIILVMPTVMLVHQLLLALGMILIEIAMTAMHLEAVRGRWYGIVAEIPLLLQVRMMLLLLLRMPRVLLLLLLMMLPIHKFGGHIDVRHSTWKPRHSHMSRLFQAICA